MQTIKRPRKNKETPILMKPDLVHQTILLNKTQTRRLTGLKKVNAAPDDWELLDRQEVGRRYKFRHNATGETIMIKCPYGTEKDLLYIRELHEVFWHYPNDIIDVKECGQKQIRTFTDANAPRVFDKLWKGSLKGNQWVKRPGIYYFKEFVRVWLKIKSVRPERLCDITEEDAIAEGVRGGPQMFFILWDNIHGKEAPVEINPWVFRIEFEKIEAPVETDAV